MGGEDHLHGGETGEFAMSKMPQHGDDFSQQKRVKSVLGFFERQNMNKGFHIRQQQERKQDDCPIGDLRRLVPYLVVPAVLKDKSVLALRERPSVDIGVKGSEIAKTLGDFVLCL